MPLEGDAVDTVVLRPARKEDAPALRRVFELASEGLAPWVWAQSARPDADADQIGLESMQKKIDKAAPGTILMAEIDGQVAGGVVTYDIGDEPEEIEADTPPVFVPLIELENMAPRTHYVNALAVFPEFRGRGIGRRLLRAALAHQGPNGMSLIAEDSNSMALSLYASEWYVETARRPTVPAAGLNFPGKNWILLVRPPE